MKTLRGLGLIAVVAAAWCGGAWCEALYANGRDVAHPTELDRYVAEPDPAFTYELANTFESDDATGYVLDMTSQRWRSEAEVDRVAWQHFVTIVVPKQCASDTALMIIGGGDNKKGRAPRGGDRNLHAVAEATGCVAAMVSCIPNQPLCFADEDRGWVEDGIIAYTWDKFLRTGDKRWPLRLPMTKAVVRAMDATQAFLAAPERGGLAVNDFVVAGASKRGWTTWTTAAVDKRVVGLVPMVIDLLNIVVSFEHHKAALGFWAPAVGDYVKRGIMPWMGTPEYDALAALVDPYSYIQRLDVPKLVMNASGDHFFLPDSMRFYERDLPGPTWVRYVPNTGHGLNLTARESIISFFDAVAKDAPIPRYTWAELDATATWVRTPDAPSSVKLWQATNPENRDFRITEIGETYTATDLEEDRDRGVYVGRIEPPEKGWTAFFIELTFPGLDGAPFRFTTPVRVYPDTTPHEYERADPLPRGFITK